MLLCALRNRSVPMDTVGEFEIQTRQQVANAHRIVIKLGTNVIMRDDGAAAVGLLYGLIESVVNIRRDGKEIMLVSSGAIGLGAKHLGLRVFARRTRAEASMRSRWAKPADVVI